ncbi:hypothetical protein EVAR_83935_1 [Eumeta japonica]|uniref:F-box domain-containing protein n=1 Tax=Eumeta variegata TaxID=151549 RepID=A0A4C1XVH7_EUMVA|nr:hypothetical protein EVAR_83935_1 [Eumeta japonica]
MRIAFAHTQIGIQLKEYTQVGLLAVTRVEKGMLQWFGYLERINDSRLTQQIYRVNVCDGRIGKGRPRKFYADHGGIFKRVIHTVKLQTGNVRIPTCFFIGYSRGKRAGEPLKSRRSSPPMDTCSPKRVTNALPASWKRKGHLMAGDRVDKRGEGERATKTHTHWTKRNCGSRYPMFVFCESVDAVTAMTTAGVSGHTGLAKALRCKPLNLERRERKRACRTSGMIITRNRYKLGKLSNAGLELGLKMSCGSGGGACGAGCGGARRRPPPPPAPTLSEHFSELSLDQGYHTLADCGPPRRRHPIYLASATPAPPAPSQFSDAVWFKILSYLEINELCVASRVCRRWHRLAARLYHQPGAWRRLRTVGELSTAARRAAERAGVCAGALREWRAKSPIVSADRINKTTANCIRSQTIPSLTHILYRIPLRFDSRGNHLAGHRKVDRHRHQRIPATPEESFVRCRPFELTLLRLLCQSSLGIPLLVNHSRATL